MKLIRQRESLGAEQDYRRALSILDAARSGGTEPVLRVYQPRPTVAFGRRDELNPGFSRARQAAPSPLSCAAWVVARPPTTAGAW